MVSQVCPLIGKLSPASSARPAASPKLAPVSPVIDVKSDAKLKR